MTISAPRNRRAEDIRVLAVIVSERKFRDVKRQIFVARLVEAADNPALKQRPETLDSVGVNRTNYVLLNFVVHSLARIFLQAGIDLMFIGRQQADFVRNRLAHKSLNVSLVDAIEHARNDVTLALHRADDGRFAGAGPAALTVVPLVPVAIVVLTADPCFVHLNDTAKLLLRLYHRRTDFVGHVQCGFVGAEAHLPLNLQRANPLFAGGHKMHDLEPLPQRLVGVLKNRSGNMREAVALIRRALIALPLEGHRSDGKHLHGTTARANDALRPAALHQVRLASVLIGKHRLELAFGHLVDGLRTLGRHIGSSEYAATIVPFSVPVKRQIIAS